VSVTAAPIHLDVLRPEIVVLRAPMDAPAPVDASVEAPAIRVRDLHYAHQGAPGGLGRRARATHALRGVSFDVPARAHTVLTGPSGSGKTTLLNCLAGALTPTSGTVERLGAVAVVHQDLRLVAERTALANVLDGCLGRVRGVRRVLREPAHERAEARRLLERLGLAERAGALVRELSGGERRRVAIARALMQRPRVLLADEPTCSLDPENSERVMRLLTEVARERGVTLVTVLHDEALARRYAQRRLHLREGVLAPAPGAAALSAAPTSGCAAACATPADAACPCAADDAPCATPPALPERPAWMRPAALLGLGLLGAGAYAWSVASLGLHEAAGRAAASGVAGFGAALLPASWAEVAELPWASMGGALLQTLQMSLIGTGVGVCLAYPAAVLAARNVSPAWVRTPVRQLLNFTRTVPSLIWALFCVAAVGLGPLAGVLALSLYSAGYLGKFFYEAFEHAPRGPQEALRAIGASGLQRFRRAVRPATRPAVVAAVLFMLEYNVRAASVLGVVGAGGIGYDIKFYLDIRNFPAALACLLLVFAVVVVLDACSARLRRRLVAE
jgi:phosphonate transport system permease protein